MLKNKKDQVEQRNYVIRPALKEKFTKTVIFNYNQRKFMILSMMCSRKT